MQLSSSAVEDLLEWFPVGRLATVRPDGAPHQVPVVFARSGGKLWSPVDGKPKAPGELARVRNVLANPRVSLLLDAYDPDWTRLWWLRVDAEAEVVRVTERVGPREVSEAITALRHKYPQYAATAVLREDATLLALEPRRVTSWCADEADPRV